MKYHVFSGGESKAILAESHLGAARKAVQSAFNLFQPVKLGYLLAVTGDDKEPVYFDTLGIAADLGIEVEAREEVVL